MKHLPAEKDSCLALTPDTALRSVILDSWERSRAAGVQPELAHISFRRVSDAELEQRLRASAELLDVARPHLEWLSSAHAQIPHVAYVVDRDGIVLHSTGTDAEAMRAAGLLPGYDWAEATMGTNAAGTALVVDQPLTVEGPEHYAKPLHGHACTGGPVHGPMGDVVGAIDFSTDAGHASSERLLLVAHVAYAIGQELRHRDALRLTDGNLEAERRLAEELRQSKARFHGAFDHAAIGMAITSPDGRWISVNSSLCEILGYAEEDLVGGTFLSLTHPDDMVPSMELFRRALAGEIERYQMEKRYLHEQGHTVWAALNAVLVRDAAGAPLYFIAQLQDITERKRTEHALRESEERYRQLVETVPDGIAVHADGRFRYVNPAMVQLLGYDTPEELVGLSVLNMVHPESRDNVRKRMEAVRTGTGVPFQELRILRRDGTPVEVETTGVPTVFQGAPAVQTLVRDVAVRKRAAHALQASELRYRTLVETAHEGVWVVDQVGSTTYVNPRLSRMLGYASTEMLGRLIFDFMPPDAAFQARTLFARRQRGMADVHDLTFRRRDGSELYALVATSPLTDSDGAFAGALAMVTDITERRRADQALRESDTRYRQIAANTPGMVYQFVYRPDGSKGFTFTSEGARELFDVAPEAFLRDHIAIFDLIHPDDQASLYASGAAAIAALAPWRWEGRAVLPTGEEKWIQATSRQERQPDGSILSHGLLLDVTERRRAAVALKESEERFRQLAESVRDVFYLRDMADSHLLYVSPAYESLWGRSREQLNAAPDSWCEAVHPDDLTRALEVRPTGPTDLCEVEYRVVRPDGTIRWVRERRFPIHNERGEVYRRGGIVEDITERQEAAEQVQRSERRFRSLIENASDLVAIIDEQSRLQYYSPAYDRILGFATGETIGKSIFALVHPDDLPGAQARLAELMQMPGESTTIEIRYRHKLGAWRTFMVTATNLLDDPAVGGIVLNSHDVTEHRALEAQFRQAQKMEAVGQLAGGVAHDFNNLLTGIISYSQLLLEEFHSEDARRDDVVEIKRAADRAAALTRQLLTFSRQQVVQPRMLSLNTVISELEKMLCRLVREDIDLRMALAPALGTIEADPGQLEQVLMNLVVNGRDAMPGGGRLTIETANVELTDAYVQWHDGTTIVPGKYVMVAVSDTGTGMTPEVQSRIFEPFFTTKEVGQGTGLGLATVYGIVKQAHGYVWVYSEPGHGTTFKIYLPRIEASEAPAEAPTARRGAVSRGAETILLVEDDQAVRMVARRILACWGYTVLEAVTGAEALLIVERQGSEIDLVLTDMVMPEMSGPELASVLRERHPALRVLFMSGYSRNVLQQKRVFGAGSAYLEKPFTPEGLAAKVREVLDGGSSAD